MIAAAVLTNYDGEILVVVSRRLPFLNVNVGKASTALLGVEEAIKLSSTLHVILEGDSLSTILALHSSCLDREWSSAAIISDISYLFFFFLSWSATKVSRSVNFRAHLVAKWAASHHCYGSILTSLAFLDSVRIKSDKDPP
jgi:hypothetical protein